MTIDQVVQVVQVAYPQVYLACHTRHQRKRSSDHQLSARDAAILAHLDLEHPMLPSRLAHHLNVTRSTLSEALKRLTALGFVARVSAGAAGDRRSSGALLTPKGARAIRDTSVLETRQLRAAIQHASRDDRAAIVLGMNRLADACRRMTGERTRV
jgi:MarR family transcriptional regulator, organic hydroperoxide resistance regulator